MRVISGKARGTKLYTLESDATRPTLDRVKESLINIIRNKIIGASVLDLFAGSGALGIEALSNGAENAIFCDKSRQAVNIINKNLQKTNLLDKSEIIVKDYEKCLEDLSKENKKIDIIFLDPPYNTDFAVIAVDKIMQFDILNKDGIIIVETDNEEVEQKLKLLKINIYDIRKYGRAKLIFISRKG